MPFKSKLAAASFSKHDSNTFLKNSQSFPRMAQPCKMFFSCLKRAEDSLSHLNLSVNPASHHSFFDDEDEDTNHQDPEHFSNLILIRDHPARIRRRSSAVPGTAAIIEDGVLEEVCQVTGEEPEQPADKMSRADRKHFVRRLSQSTELNTSDLKSIKTRAASLDAGVVHSARFQRQSFGGMQVDQNSIYSRRESVPSQPCTGGSR